MKRLLVSLLMVLSWAQLRAQPKLSADAAVMTSAEAAAIDAAGARVALTTPAHLVFVGDSLTAFYPELNYVAIVREQLQRRFGSDVKVTNAAVRGDTITRIGARLEADVLSLTPLPTHVFVFVGHNDSKVSWKSGYQESEVSLEDFRTQYREVLGRLRDKFHPRITVISTASSVFEITQASAEKKAREKAQHNLFGDPAWLEKFNTVAREIAAEFGAGYLDVYGPIKDHPRKTELFTADGVHINQHGNRFIAVMVLNSLAQEGK